MIRLQELIENPPLIHQEASGELASWQLSDEVLDYIDHHVREDSVTLETGTGISTILFAIKSSYHICINPDRQQVERIQAYCQQHRINTDKIEFIIDYSENVLPSLDIDHLDLVLIDGSHAFPLPFIDWYYTYQKLKVGGKMIVDDTQLWTGLVLKRFLILEPEWQYERNSPPRSAIFTKVGSCVEAKWHGQQPYVVQKSHLHVFNAKIQRFWQLLREKNFNRIGQLVNRQINLK